MATQGEARKRVRGKDKRTLILDSIRDQALIGLSDADTNDVAEQAFFGAIARSAFDPDDSARGVCLSALLDRGWSKLKPEGERVTFELKSDNPYEQSVEVLKAVSTGDLSVDQGATLINALSSVIKIKEIQEFDERLKALEEDNEQD